MPEKTRTSPIEKRIPLNFHESQVAIVQMDLAVARKSLFHGISTSPLDKKFSD
jgi:hypothetical protein